MVAPAWNPNTQESEAGQEPQVGASLGNTALMHLISLLSVSGSLVCCIEGTLLRIIRLDYQSTGVDVNSPGNSEQQYKKNPFSPRFA